MALLNRADKSTGTAGAHLPDRCSRDSVAGAQFGLDLKVEGLVFYFLLKHGREVKDVLNKVDLSLQFLVEIDGHVDAYIGTNGQSTCIGNYVPLRDMGALNVYPVQ